MKDELLNKIQQVMIRPITEEMHVVYLFVEIRKLMDRDRKFKDPVLRTFCNWVVHIDLKREATGSAEILAELDRVLIRNREGRDFKEPLRQTSANGLRDSLKSFSAHFGLDAPFLFNDGDWERFTCLYSSVVSECPIVYSASKQNLKYVENARLSASVTGRALAWRITAKDGRVLNLIVAHEAIWDHPEDPVAE